MYGKILDKNILQQWGAYVHVVFYFTLDCNRMDTCMHSRTRTPTTLSRARAGPRKGSPSEGGQKVWVIGSIETASLEIECSAGNPKTMQIVSPHRVRLGFNQGWGRATDQGKGRLLVK